MPETSRAFEPVHVELPAAPSTARLGGERLVGSPLVFLCEHASAIFPPVFGDLGISAETRSSHVAWDPGALEVARRLARRFSAPLAYGGVSRLLYDCNRPPEAPDAIPPRSELHAIPGNEGLSAEVRADRVEAIYRPFVARVSRLLEETRPVALVTVHSFTRIYYGRERGVEIGLLHDADARLAEAMLAHAGNCGFAVARNQPYGPEDGVTHSLKLHAEARGLLNVMIEIRNDLIATAAEQDRVAEALAGLLAAGLRDLAVDPAVDLGEVS